MAESKGGEGGSLLAKVFRFVRNPAGSWGEFDAPEEARESGYSKQMLKEMIERKRRNDFVRRREFDMLRKLRRSEAMSGQDATGRPSFFQSSLPSRPDDRASTLKKIDEIEAQMSQQWWKTRNADPTSTGGLSAGNSGLPVNTSPMSGMSLPAVETEGASPRAEPPVLFTVVTEGGARVSPDTSQPEFDTLPMAAMEASAQHASQAPSEDVRASVMPEYFELAQPTEPAALDALPGEYAHDVELEDAAIRFANGDDAGAEAVLRRLVSADGGRREHVETWLALFDLYRATGQQEPFDEAAVEFAGRFNRSAPQWLVLSGNSTLGASAQPNASDASAARAAADWNAPAVLTTQGVAGLQAVVARAGGPCRLSWARINRIDEAAVEPLTRLLSQWVGQPLRLHFLAAERLEELLRQHTVSGDRAAGVGWWKLRMEALRVMHLADEFELVALDYCVTYEVSPPSWEKPRCQYKAIAADGSELGAERFSDSVVSSFAASSFYGDGGPSSRAPRPLRSELAGSLYGDAALALDRLPPVLPGEELQVTCSRLVRVDFAAAGSLLNWSTARQSEGCMIQFTDVHRLIAPFFGVVGIHGVARVHLRRD
ncbi:STAS domain-containing protein [Ramlibacter sp. AN1015]|uniref:type IV pilus assembly protein FimV n=1 Tax=Ramlibacter sp. AN1015 TaxID=3133428 RepID=UPI0030C64215